MSRKKNKERIPLTKDFFTHSQSSLYNKMNFSSTAFNLSNNPTTTIFSSQRNDLHELQEKYFVNDSVTHSNNIIKDEHSETRSKDNEEIALTISKDKFIYIKTKDNSNIEVNLLIISSFTILELKKFVFPKVFEEKNIRLIFNGRMLNDVETIANLNFDSGTFIHAFISEKVEKREKTITNVTNNDFQNNVNTIRGFERLKDLGILQEDIILQKFAFHSHFVVIQKEPQIEFNNLVNREDEWYAMNIEKLGNPETNVNWFRSFDFNEEANPEKIKGKVSCFWIILAFVLGFFAMIAVFPLLFVKRIKVKIKEAMLIGLLSKMFYICLIYIVIRELKFVI